MTYRAFITRYIPEASRDTLSQSYAKKHPDLQIEWDIWPHNSPPTPKELKEKLKNADALISLLSNKIDAECLDSTNRLKVISNYAVGYNNIDLEAAREYKILVTNTPDVLTDATADLAFTLLLSLTRNIQAAASNALSGQWQGWEPQGFLGTDLRNKTLGIVGMGRIGKEMARLCHSAFQMNVVYTNSSGPGHLPHSWDWATYNTLDDLLRSADVVSLHCPLKKDTRGLLNSHKLKLMKDEAYLINTSRGELIDSQALLKELKQERFLGVGLDVTDPEPLPPTHELYQYSRVLITPHIGSATHKAREQMANLCYENVLRALVGEELLTPVY